MNKSPLLLLLFILVAGAFSTATAQRTQSQKSDSVETRELPATANNQTFRDDSTDANVSNSNLSGSSGTAAASGAGGQGAVENPGRNTSSDIYNIERRDSIEQAREDSVSNVRKPGTNNESN